MILPPTNRTSTLLPEHFHNQDKYRMTSPISQPAATIQSLDHLVLTVKSVDATKEWYTKNLGMKHEAFISASTPDITRHSLIFGSQKINLHESGKVCLLPKYPPLSPFFLEVPDIKNTTCCKLTTERNSNRKPSKFNQDPRISVSSLPTRYRK